MRPQLTWAVRAAAPGVGHAGVWSWQVISGWVRFSFPEASGTALMNMPRGGTEAVRQLEPWAGGKRQHPCAGWLWVLPVDGETAARQAGAPPCTGVEGVYL